MSFSTTLGRPSLNDKLLQVCAFHVRVLARVSDAVEAPLSSDGASVAMLTPFNREKLESLAFLNAGGEGVIAARNFPGELPLFHGPNVRFAVCMDGAGNARDADLLRTDKLEVPTVIYGNATASLGELMLENGQRRTSPLRLVASSSDEHSYQLVLELTPQGTAQHYTAANLARVARVSAQHVPMDLIARALQECVRVRRQAMVGYLQTQGVPEIDASTFYMTLPMGSLYDISAAAGAGDAEDAKPVTVDISQWQALVSKTSAALAETHTVRLCETMLKFLTHTVAGAGVDVRRPDAVREHLARENGTAEGRAAILHGFMAALQRANENSFVYTSDSEIRGFAVENTVDGVRLRAQFAATGEKQNLFGMDPLTSSLSLERNAELFAARAGAEYREAMAGCDVRGQAAAGRRYEEHMTRVNQKRSLLEFRSDCEDGASVLAAVTSVANSMDGAHMAACIAEVFAAGIFSAGARGLEASVQEAVLVLRDNLGDKYVGLCFAHAANIEQMKGVGAAPGDAGVQGNYEGLVQSINAGELNGHACLFSVRHDAASEEVSPHIRKTRFSGLLAHESTNPMELAASDPKCMFSTSSSLPDLDKKLVDVNGRIPVSFAKSVVSEITAKGAQNITGCVSSAVTYTSVDSPFYHTLIAAKGYAYSQRNGTCLPTCHISTLGDGVTEHFLLEGALLPTVQIAGVGYSEDELLDIVVGSASCLAPSLQRVLRTREAAGFHVYAESPPADAARFTRVVMRGRMTPLGTDAPAEESLHVAEHAARQQAAEAVHPHAQAVSSNSQCWDLYVPTS